jgi:hypothetical protein
MHLTSGVPRKLQEALKGYQAIQNDELEPLIRALILINTTLLMRLGMRERPSYPEEALRCVGAVLTVLREIERLIFELPEEKIFKGQLARFASQVRAARRFVMEQGQEFSVSIDEERSICSWSDRDGNEVLISDCFDSPGPKRVFRCVADSQIARCAQELWRHEQVRWGDQRTVLYRVPTRKELREYLCLDEPAVTKLCQREGFAWLPKAQRG